MYQNYFCLPLESSAFKAFLSDIAISYFLRIWYLSILDCASFQEASHSKLLCFSFLWHSCCKWAVIQIQVDQQVLNFSLLNYIRSLVGWSLLSQVLSNWCVSAVRRLRLTFEDNTLSSKWQLLSVTTQELGRKWGKRKQQALTWEEKPGFWCQLCSHVLSMTSQCWICQLSWQQWWELRYLPAEDSL